MLGRTLASVYLSYKQSLYVLCSVHFSPFIIVEVKNCQEYCSCRYGPIPSYNCVYYPYVPEAKAKKFKRKSLHSAFPNTLRPVCVPCNHMCVSVCVFVISG